GRGLYVTDRAARAVACGRPRGDAITGGQAGRRHGRGVPAMTEPTIGNDEIREDQQAFMAAYERAKVELGAIPGVVGVGFGHKQVGGVFSDDVCLIVFVREKRPAADIPPDERIPASYEGYGTDVREPVDTVSIGCDNETEYSTIQGGIQIQAEPTSAGTLGCIVRRRGDAGRENV